MYTVRCCKVDTCIVLYEQLLGPQGQRTAHQDHWSQGKNRRNVQEEINCLHLISLINCSVEFIFVSFKHCSTFRPTESGKYELRALPRPRPRPPAVRGPAPVHLPGQQHSQQGHQAVWEEVPLRWEDRNLLELRPGQKSID